MGQVIEIRQKIAEMLERANGYKTFTDCQEYQREGKIAVLEDVLEMLEEYGIKKFRLHWLDGATVGIEGYDIADACRRAGYGAEVLGYPVTDNVRGVPLKLDQMIAKALANAPITDANSMEWAFAIGLMKKGVDDLRDMVEKC